MNGGIHSGTLYEGTQLSVRGLIGEPDNRRPVVMAKVVVCRRCGGGSGGGSCRDEWWAAAAVTGPAVPEVNGNLFSAVKQGRGPGR